ncbi:MAG TPA: sulfotransferase, partial [Kofleriaceae bacterium]|nr:sulfotransferase [Kofleriaceae bacterium]
YLAPVARSYGDLREPESRRALVRDALRLLRVHIHPWSGVIDEDRVVAEATPTLFGVVAAIYEQHRVAAGAARWGCKSTFMVDHVEEALAEYPAARFVWLVRDPRDVAASARRSVFGPYHPRLTAILWREQQERALAAQEAHGARVVHLLRYEDLVARPDEEVRRLCRFLGEELEPAMLAHHRQAAAQELAALSESWRNADQPISQASVGRYRGGLSSREREAVEEVAGPLMARLGYSTEPRLGAAEGPPTLAVRAGDLTMRLAVEVRSLLHDENHWWRWRRDATVRWLEIKARARGAAR